MTRLHTSDTDISAALRARSAARRASGRGRGRSGGGGGGAAPAIVTAITPVSSTGYYRSAIGTNVTGTPCAIGIVCRIRSLTPTTSFLVHNGDTGGTARGLLIRAGGGVLFGTVIDGVGAARSTPSWSMTGVDLVHSFVVVADVTSGRARLYVDGAEISIGTVCTGYTVPGGSDYIAIGASSGGAVVANQFDFVGVSVASGGIPSAADVATWWNACKAANDCVSFPSSTTNRWQASDNPTAAASWTDDIGSMVVSRAGAPTAGTFVPVYA